MEKGLDKGGQGLVQHERQNMEILYYLNTDGLSSLDRWPGQGDRKVG